MGVGGGGGTEKDENATGWPVATGHVDSAWPGTAWPSVQTPAFFGCELELPGLGCVRFCREHSHKDKLQGLVYDTLPSATAVFSYAIGSRKLSANEQFFVVVGAQTAASLLQTTQIISDVCFITMLLTPAQMKAKSFESRRNFFSSFFTRGGCVSCLRGCVGARLLPQSHQYPNLSEGADRVGGQLRGDKECPFSGVTKFGRVWRLGRCRKAMLGSVPQRQRPQKQVSRAPQQQDVRDNPPSCDSSAPPPCSLLP